MFEVSWGFVLGIFLSTLGQTPLTNIHVLSNRETLPVRSLPGFNSWGKVGTFWRKSLLLCRERTLHGPHCFCHFFICSWKSLFLKPSINLVIPSPRDKRQHIFTENKQKLLPTSCINKAVSVFPECMKTMPENGTNNGLTCFAPKHMQTIHLSPGH